MDRIAGTLRTSCGVHSRRCDALDDRNSRTVSFFVERRVSLEAKASIMRVGPYLSQPCKSVSMSNLLEGSKNLPRPPCIVRVYRGGGRRRGLGTYPDLRTNDARADRESPAAALAAALDEFAGLGSGREHLPAVGGGVDLAVVEGAAAATAQEAAEAQQARDPGEDAAVPLWE